MKVLHLRWQRLVNEADRTCDRCGATGAEIERAVGMLTRSLGELGVEVVLETQALDPAAFAQAPLESNRIWIGGLPIEWLLSATSGRSRCCSACGEADCRTLIVEGRTYEAIPCELIVRAGLLAAARLFPAGPSEPCCNTPGKAAPAPGRALRSSQCGCGSADEPGRRRT